MAKWQQYLKNYLPRADAGESIVAEHLHEFRPALFNRGSLLIAVAVSVRLLEVVSKRGGTRIMPSTLDKVLHILDHAMPQEVVHHCDDEVVRILQWLEGNFPVVLSSENIADESAMEISDLEIMRESDIQSRLAVVEFALRDDFDLELEYYEESTDTWPRMRATPLEIQYSEQIPMLLLQQGSEDVRCLEIARIRWLMPVLRVEKKGSTQGPKLARVLTFPKRDETE